MFYIYQIRTYLPELKENYSRILAFCFFLLLSLPLSGQQQRLRLVQENPFYELYQLQPAGGEARVRPKSLFTSLALSLPEAESYQGVYVLLGSDTLRLQAAAHQPESAAGVVSELLVFDTPQQSLQLFGIPEKGPVWIHCMYAAPLKEGAASSFRQQREQGCAEPAAVQQSVWRQGLPEPAYTRSFNEVDHLIVHHSATSNSATTNYTEVVRNIYLYHTQANGWSDIGYNYLIAPDGTLYAGRDPGAGGAQDKVRGAHFCGKNKETMGICLLGNFMETAPAPMAVNTLNGLLSWKAFKEGMDPLAVASHPANPSLPVIAGHRNGCATACPGDYLYALLPEVRLEVAETLLACAEPDEAYVYVNALKTEICLGNMDEKEVDTIRIYTLQGKEVAPKAYRLRRSDLCWRLEELGAGIYILLAEGKGQYIRKKIFLL